MRLKRWFVESGIHPLLGILIAGTLFLFGTKYLFLKTELAKWIFILIGLSIIIQLGESKRTRRLKVIFRKKHYLIIRLIEILLVSFPFLIYLGYENEYLLLLALLILSVLLAFDTFRLTINKTITTPFKKYPFENIIGFRKAIIFIILAYFVLIKAFQVDNYNLAIAVYGFLFLLMISFNVAPEKKYFVWIFSDTSFGFLFKKISSSFICTTIITLPSILAIHFFFPNFFLVSSLVGIIGYIFIIALILAKYSAFPKEMNVPQALLLGLSIWFPPMLLIVIPIFYKRSKQNLDFILQ